MVKESKKKRKFKQTDLQKLLDFLKNEKEKETKKDDSI